MAAGQPTAMTTGIDEFLDRGSSGCRPAVKTHCVRTIGGSLMTSLKVAIVFMQELHEYHMLLHEQANVALLVDSSVCR
jgi:hypothetical protein